MNLIGHFSVWHATNEARILHGRWVAAHYDVDELKSETAKFLESDRRLLTVGLIGVEDEE